MRWPVYLSFYSMTQKFVWRSSTEEEYVEMATGFRETIFMQYTRSFVFPDRGVGCTGEEG